MLNNKISKERVFFPNLNGIRFIAALGVIIHHIEQWKGLSNLPNYFWKGNIFLLGKLGVVLFFVLSGFLITFLLLKEKEVNQDISIKAFYIRRVLRIWPLYYLIAIISFFLVPQINFFSEASLSLTIKDNFIANILLFVFFLPNLALVLFGGGSFATQAWSVGVEEQFYLLWPWLIKKFRNIKLAVIVILGLTVAIRIILLASRKFSDEVYMVEILHEFWKLFNIDCMAIGSFGAILVYEKSKIISVLFNRYFQIFIYSITLLVLILGVDFYGTYLSYLSYDFYALLFIIIIINLATNPKSIFNLENKIFNFLGNISFGLYMFHPICIFITIKIYKTFFSSFNMNFVIYFLSLIITILVASLSYYYYEKKFLKVKNRYAKVLSGA